MNEGFVGIDPAAAQGAVMHLRASERETQEAKAYLDMAVASADLGTWMAGEVGAVRSLLAQSAGQSGELISLLQRKIAEARAADNAYQSVPTDIDVPPDWQSPCPPWPQPPLPDRTEVLDVILEDLDIDLPPSGQPPYQTTPMHPDRMDEIPDDLDDVWHGRVGSGDLLDELREVVVDRAEPATTSAPDGAPTPTAPTTVASSAPSPAGPSEPIPTSVLGGPSDSSGLASDAGANAVPVSGGGIEAAAQAAYNAGFRGDDLVRIVAIAGRESRWTPNAHRSDVDKSLGSGDRGLWQINYIWDDQLRAAGIIDDWTDLFDPNVNARAARYVFSKQGWPAWGFTGSGWGAGPSVTGTDLEGARRTLQQMGLIEEEH